MLKHSTLSLYFLERRVNMTDKKQTKREDEILQVVITLSILTLVAVRLMNQDISRRPIVNNFYVINDKIIPFRFR